MSPIGISILSRSKDTSLPPSLPLLFFYLSLVSKRAAGWKLRNPEEKPEEITKVDQGSKLWLSTCR